MAVKSGIAAQMCVIDETTVGTYAAPTLALPILSETVAQTKERLESAGIIAGKRVLMSQQWNGGQNKVGGDIQMEVYDRGLGQLFKHMFGSVSTTGTNPYTHTFTPGTLDGLSQTIQIGRPGVSGTVQPFSYLGCKISDWELACKAGEIATLGLTILAMSETTANSLATPTYTTGSKPVKFNHGVFSIAGSQVGCKEISIKGANNLADDRWFLGSQNLSEPLEKDLREYTFEATIEFTDLTQYTTYINGAEVALSLVFTVGSNTLTISGNVRYDGDTPNVTGRDILEQKIPGKFIASGGTDSTAITAVIVDTVATP